MKLRGCVAAVAMALMLSVSNLAWANLCWQDNFGGMLILEVGPAFGPGDRLVLVAGSYGYGPPFGCGSVPGMALAQGIARISLFPPGVPLPPEAYVGLTIYDERSPDCGSKIGEFYFDLTTLRGIGIIRSAPHFDQPVQVELTPILPPVICPVP